MTNANMITQIMANLGVNYQPAILSGQQYMQHLNQINRAIINHQHQLHTIQGQINSLTGGMNTLNQGFAGWYMSFAAMAKMNQALSYTLETMGEVEMGMTKIARVTEDATASFSQMRSELFQLAKDYGTNISTVQDIALRWAQAGYNVADSLELTRTSLLAVNTAEMNAEQSTQALIGIMAQWQTSVKEMPLILDKINLTADNYAVTSQDLIDGLLRSSGAARVMNMTLDETIGVLTAMRESSGRTGREVGNALNSILSYMQRDKAIDLFESIGVEVFTDKAKTQFRNVIDIFNELAANWDSVSEQIKDGFVESADEAGLFNEELATAVGIQQEWTDLQKRDIGQAAAGVYRRNYLIALLKNFSQVQEVINGLHEAEGYSLKENARTMETYQKKVEAMRASFAELAVTVGESGLLDTMKNLADGTRESIDAFQELPPVVQNFIIMFTEVSAVILAANLALRLFAGTNILAALTNISQGMLRAATTTGLFSGALRALSAHPIIAVLTGIGLLTIAIKSYNKAQEQAVQNAIDATITSQNNAQKVTELGQRHEELTAKLAEGKDVQGELNAVMSQIGEIFPQVVTQWDAQGNAIAINNNLLRENILLAQEAVKANALAGIATISKRLSSLGEKKAGYQSELDPGYNILNAYRANRSDIEGHIKEIESQERELYSQLARFSSMAYGDKEYGLVGARMAESINKATASTKKNTEANNVNAGSLKKGSGATKDYMDALEKYITLSTAMTERENDLNAATQRQIDLSQARLAYFSRENASTEDQIRYDQERTFVMELYRQKQEGIHRETELLRGSIEKLKDKQGALNTSTEDGYDAYEKLQQEIEELESRAGQLSVEWWQLQTSMAEVASTTGPQLTKALDEIKNRFDRGIISLQQYIDLLNQLEGQGGIGIDLQKEINSAQAGAIALKWERQLEDALERARKDFERAIKGIDREIERVGDKATSRIENLRAEIDKLNESLEEELEILQAQLDALDQMEKQDEREKATEEHNARLKALQDDKTWYILKDQEKYAFEIAALDKQIADEQASWSEQVKQWQIEDERERIQGLMDAAKERADLRKQELEDQIAHWEEWREKQIEALNEEKERLREHWNNAEEGIRKIMQQGLIDTIADMAARDPEFKARGQAIIDNLVDGILERKGRLKDEIDDIKDMISEINDLNDSVPGVSGGGTGGGGGGSSGGSGGGGGWSPGIPINQPISPGWDKITVNNGKISYAAEGGIATRPTFGVWGEAGTEALIPLEKLRPMMSDSLKVAIREMHLGLPTRFTAATQQPALERAIYELSASMPKEIVTIVQIDSEVVAQKTVPIIGAAMRQPVRSS